MMRRFSRLVGVVLSGCLLLGLLVAPAQAQPGEGLVGAFAGTAQVGKWFSTTCDKEGVGQPTGRGLYAPKPVSFKPTGPANDDNQRERHGTWQFSNTGPGGNGIAVGNLQPKPNGAGSGGFALSIAACGWLDALPGTDAVNADKGPRRNGLGAACGAAKGHDGLGKVTATNLVNGTSQSGKLQRLGWKASAGGVLPILGDLVPYNNLSGQKKAKKYQILTLVNAFAGPECSGIKPGNLLHPLCKPPSTLNCNNGNGAQVFDIVGVFVVLNTGSLGSLSWNDVFPVPKDKKCKGVGPEASIGPDGKKSHDNKPAVGPCPTKKS